MWTKKILLITIFSIIFSSSANALFIDKFTDTNNVDLNIHETDWNAYAESNQMFWFAKIFNNQAWIRGDQNGSNNFVKVNLENNDVNLTDLTGLTYSVKFQLKDINYISGSASQIQNTIIRPSDGNFLVNLRFLRGSVGGDINAVTQYNGTDITNTLVSADDYFEIRLLRKNTFIYDINFFRNGSSLASAGDKNINSDTFNFQFGLDLGGSTTYMVDDFNITSDANLSANVIYSNYQTHLSNNYVKDLNLAINYNCITGLDANIQRAINDVNEKNYSLTCDNTLKTVNDTYSHSTNGQYNIKFYLRDYNNNVITKISDSNFISDLNAPTIDLNFSSSSTGFFTGSIATGTIYLTCSDQISPKVDYNIFNEFDLNVFSGRYDANSTQSKNIDANTGDNLFTGWCTDLVGNRVTDTNTISIYANCYTLVDEKTGVALTNGDVNAFTSITATSYSDGTVYDFKSPLGNNICYSSVGDDTVRFDMNYSSSGLGLYREFNLTILQDVNTTIPVCVADDQDFLEQLFKSSQEREVVLQNQLSLCYNMADYTKYALQDSLSARAFTIPMPYSLTTSIDGNTVMLALVNGAVEAEMNLDVLIYRIESFETGLLPDELSVALYVVPPATDSNTVAIYYRNYAVDNTEVLIKIYDDTNQIYSQTITSTPNAFTIYFDTTAIDLNSEILKIQITKTLSDGSQENITRYFTMSGNASIFPAGIGIIFSFIIILFGLTLVKWQAALSWFGLIVIIGGIAVLSLSPASGAVIFLQAVLLIAASYVFLVYKDETVRT